MDSVLCSGLLFFLDRLGRLLHLFLLVHAAELLLIVLLDRLALQLESGRHEAGLGGPQLRDEGDVAGQLEALEAGLLAVGADLLQHGLGELALGADLLEALVLQTHRLGEVGDLVAVGDAEGHAEGLRALAVDADVVHERAGLEHGLDLAEGDVLAVLQLDQVLLAVHDLDGAVVPELADVAGLEPPGAVAVGGEVLLCLFGHAVVAGGDIASADDDFAWSKEGRKKNVIARRIFSVVAEDKRMPSY